VLGPDSDLPTESLALAVEGSYCKGLQYSSWLLPSARLLYTNSVTTRLADVLLVCVLLVILFNSNTLRSFIYYYYTVLYQGGREQEVEEARPSPEARNASWFFTCLLACITSPLRLYSPEGAAAEACVDQNLFSPCLVGSQNPKSCYSICHIECLQSVHGALNVDEKKN